MDVQEPTFKVFSGSDLVFSFEQPASDTSSHSGSASSLVQTLKLAKTHVNQCLTDLVRNSAGKEGNKDAGHFEDGSGNEDDDGDEDVQDETRASSKSPHTDVISKRKLDCVLGNGSKCGSGVVAAEEKRIKS